MNERTFAIIKPDAFRMNVVGKIISHAEANGLSIIASRTTRLDSRAAEGFYAEHKGKEFYEPLIVFMTSGPSMLIVFEGEHAIERWRELMGKTDFTAAAPDTIRRRFATSVRYNAVHGSDSAASAAREIAFFFKPEELLQR
ncbi:MAG: nucleoside-diphosphate kinase [Spirochaetes bacterium]|nr:nucleoside-diphosphate kinase [Spirochaetota bacterium]